MKPLLFWTATLAAIFSSLILLAGALGRTAPPPEFAKWFTYADGSLCPMPCLFGIRPGVTKWDEVDNILKLHPLLSELTSEPSVEGAGGEYFLFSLKARLIVKSDEDEYVTRISVLSFDSENISNLKELILVLGYPQTVSLSLYNNYQRTSFTSRNETLFFSIDDSKDNRFTCRFKLDTKIRGITLYAPNYYQKILDEYRGAEAPERYYRWLGFSRYDYWQRYYADSGEPFYACAP